MNAPLLPGFDLAPPAASVPCAAATPRVSPVKPPTPPVPGKLEMSPAYFRARQFLASLSLRERAAVASRQRFHTMPWVRPADTSDDDDLP